MRFALRKLVRRLLDRRGLDVVRAPTVSAFLRSRRVDLVLDVGANTGQFALGLRERGYSGPIHSFEPVAEVFKTLSKRAARDRNWTASHCALGATAGAARMNVFQNTEFNSLKAQSELGRRFGCGFELQRVETVEVRTLDGVIADTPARNIFLKIDTQGFEQEVLAGARQVLDRCVGLQLELPIEQLYDGVWSFTEALTQVRAAGFAPAQIRTVNTLRGDPASAIEFDCIFRRLT